MSRVQLLTLVLVVVFGGMTIFFNDERFLKIKPTLIYFFFQLFYCRRFSKNLLSRSSSGESATTFLRWLDDFNAQDGVLFSF